MVNIYIRPVVNLFFSSNGEKNSLESLVQFSVFIFFAVALAVPSGYSYGPAILLIASLFVCWRPAYWGCMSRESKILGAIFLFYVLIQALSIWWDGGRLREFDRASRVFMATLMLPLLSRYPARLTTIMGGLATGSFVAGSIAIYDKFILGIDRAFGDAMPIQSGNISMTMGLLSLCGYFWYRKEGNNRFAILMLFACSLGMLGSFFSGTRGGWVLLPLIIISILLHFRATMTKADKLAVIFLLVGGMGIFAMPQTGVLNRIEAAHSDIANYIDGRNKNTSIGIRFQLWQSAWNAFIEKPIFGWGNNGVRLAYAEQLSDEKITKYIYNFNSHAHNQFLDEMSKRGLIGLAALCLLFTLPFYYTILNVITHPIKSILLMILGSSIIDFSLTQAFISHNSGIVFYVFTLIIFYSVSKVEVDDECAG